MAARGGGRARGARGGPSSGRGGDRPDGFDASLRVALAEALDVDAEDLEVTVTRDGRPLVDVEVVAVTVREAVGTAGSGSDEPGDVGRDDESGDATTSTASRDGSREGLSDGAGDGGGSGREQGRGGRPGGPERDGDQVPVTPEELDEEAEAAADLLEGLLDAMDLPGDLRIQVHEAHAEVEIVGLSEGVLIGRRGQTLEAVQDLVRTAMQRRFERRSRVLVDVDGYRARRLEKLIERAEEAVQEVLDSGEPQRLEPMDSIERRLIHQRVAAHEGVVSHSHGREPARRIEIRLADD